MTNKENINELEAMRSQFDILKNKLNNQDIINDQLLRNAMSEKMSWIMKYVWFELLVLLPLCALSFYGMRLIIPGLPLAPMVCILLLVAISIALDFYFNRTSENDWNTENLVTTGRKLIIMKRLRWTQVAVSMPIAILLFFWYASGFEGEEAEVINIGMIVGGVIGAIVGLVILVKMNRTNDALINQIRELTKEEF
ncbi:MAG: hypothetical protein PUC79_10930 [Prevotellaceae bacterium]|nr:hypothetical protein [Prevotellaceae bacterium]